MKWAVELEGFLRVSTDQSNVCSLFDYCYAPPVRRSRLPKPRSPSASQHSRNKKSLYLPMNRSSADQICLPVRLAFEAVRQQRTDRHQANHMAQMILLT